jgi:hypothetical protein
MTLLQEVITAFMWAEIVLVGVWLGLSVLVVGVWAWVRWSTKEV